MKRILIFLMALLLLVSVPCVGGDSFDYVNATPEKLQESIKKNTSHVKKYFDEGSIKNNQAAIDFSKYQSELGNILFYSSNLSKYHNWKELLEFVRIRGLYQQLKENDWTPQERKQFANSKYEAMAENIQREIQTYEDRITISLDTCEALNHDPIFIQTVINSENYSSKMQDFLGTKFYEEYQSKRDCLKKMKPDLTGRIEAILAVWGKSGLSDPDAPIIDPDLVDQL